MVNVTGGWDESYRSYLGRSYGRTDIIFEVWSKACREKSAEAIVLWNDCYRKGRTLRSEKYMKATK
jgi:hypothetical protein